eukprot:CAMPEP_0113637722 /NCGR_PEP_ID=MMETSP0017_2-20120614/19755_1 /TAXON_ID=2856 /ORGANISM="Cylindrotheca closterium" /LENGTH=4255 /DNA_ID=CAMNT_0000548783 /DNA_START=113 /DNA_END=12880 /DNA_ORIENTATION=+ /assembly_acc=CAM_ASM_000147
MASGGPPPAFGFRPPPPPNSGGAGGQFRPPPPPGASQASSYDSEGEDDGGALTSTINLVTSAANMFFKPPPPPNAPPPPAAATTQMMPPRQPPVPIETTTSMLDDTPAAVFQAPPLPAQQQMTPQRSNSTPQQQQPQMTNISGGGSPQVMFPTIPSLKPPSHPGTPTAQFPPPRPTAAENVFGSGTPPSMPQQGAASPMATAASIGIGSSSPRNVFPGAAPAAPTPPNATTAFQAPPPAGVGGFSPPSIPQPGTPTAQFPPPRPTAESMFGSGTPPSMPQGGASPIAAAAPPAGGGFPPPSIPANNTQQQHHLRGVVNAVGVANNFMKMSPKNQPASPVVAGGGFMPPSSPVVAAAAGGGFKPPASPVVAAAGGFKPPASEGPPAAAAAGGGFQPPPSDPPAGHSLRGTIGAVGVANNFMNMKKPAAAEETASPGGFKPPSSPAPPAGGFKPPASEAPAGHTLRGTIGAVGVANNFMKMKKPAAAEETASPAQQLRGAVAAVKMSNLLKGPEVHEKQQPSPAQQLRGAVAAVKMSNLLKGPEEDEKQEPSPAQQLRGAVAAVKMSNLLKGPEVHEQQQPSPAQQLRGAVAAVKMSNLLKGPEVHEQPSPAQNLDGAVSTAKASNSLAGSSPARKPPMQKFTPPPSPRIHVSTRSPKTPLIANTSPTGRSTGQRTPIRKLNLPTPNTRARTLAGATHPHRQLRLPPKSSSSSSTPSSTTKTKTTPRSKFRLPPSRKKTTRTPEPVVNLKPKVGEAPPMPETPADKTAPASETTTATKAESSPAEPQPTEPAAASVVEETPAPAPAVTEPPKPAESALPEGWIETMDPSSGKVYYYNADTQETSWVKPTIPQAPATDNTIEVLSQLNKKTTGATAIATAASVEEEEPPKSGDAAADWSEVTDPLSGKVYYYNLVTQETSWDRPAAMDQPAKESEAATATDAKEETSAEESISKNTVSAPATDNTIEVLSQLNKKATGATAIATAASVEEEEPKSVGAAEWSEVTDPASGEVYYYNLVTQETSWDRPAAMDQPAKESEAVSATDAKEEMSTEESIENTISAPATDNTIEVLSQLNKKSTGATAISTAPSVEEEEPKSEEAAEWSEVTDPASGDVYYYNLVTQETSWDRPAAMDQPAKETEEPATAADAKEMSAEESIENTFAELNAEFGYVDPSETNDEKEEDATPAASAAEEKDALPDGWTEVVDPSSGDTYYYNPTTEETSWELPVSKTAEQASATKTAEAPSTDTTMEVLSAMSQQPEEATAPAVERSPEDDGDLPADWEEVVDPNSGDVYYFNSVTNETSWERPGANEPANDDSGEAEPVSSEEVKPEESSEPGTEEKAEESADLPADWEEVTDPTSGDVYYYNPVTDETSWERPGAEPAIDDSGEVEPSASEEVKPEESAVEEPAEETAGLPADWEEVTDPTSGDIYYYNPVANETSWERPGAEPANDVSDEAEPVSSEEVKPEESSEPAVEAAAEETAVLPADWEEVTDPTSGNVYYYNPVTDETSWERPGANEPANDDSGEAEPVSSEEVKPEESSEPAVEAAAEETAVLPADWEEVTDPTSGDIYYYNPVTNETSWERPGAEPAIDDSGEVEPSASEEVKPEESAVKEAAEETAGLPADWEEVTDPNTGDIYYYNPITNETSWERPGAEPANEDSAEVEPSASEEVKREESSEPAAEEPVAGLPAGWEQVTDPTTRDTFYYNPDTNETSWERPGAKPANDDSDEAEPVSSEEVKPEETSGPAVEEKAEEIAGLPADWEEVTDPTSGDIYYYNPVTNETSWERPGAEPAIDDNDEAEPSASKEVQPEETSEPAVEETTEETAGLPADWEEVTDPNTGDIYYYNPVTNETSWERPSDEQKNEDGAEVEPSASEDVQPEETSEPAVEEAAEETAGLPADWEEVTDPNTGDIYYYNPVTNETSWERPGAEPAIDDSGEAEPVSSEEVSPEETSEPAAEEAAEETAGLPADWAEVTDPNTGDIYYYNPVANETSWERPSVEQKNEDGAEVEPTASEDVQPEETSEPAVDSLAVAVESEHAEADAEASDLPENWTEAVNESTGQTYFYNSLTEETAWERPTKEEGVLEEQEEVQEDVDPDENIVSNVSTGAASKNIESSMLPADWIEAVDESSGQTYYYNTVTQETSWEKPSIAPDAPDEVADDHIETEENQEDAVVDETTPETDDVLPPDWIETQDGNGQVYYYNTVTNETSWERPSIERNEDAGVDEVEQEVVQEVDKPEADTADDDDDDGDNVVNENLADDQEELPSDWVEAVDESTGQTYHYNTATQETVWEKPSMVADGQEEDAGDADDDADCAAEDEQDDAVMDESPSTTEDELPADWIEAVDESSGQTYYYNTVTQETSWEKPSTAADGPEEVADDHIETEDNHDDADAGDADEAEDDASDDDQEDVVVDEIPSTTEDELPADWIEAVDESSGQTYYYNTVTQETSWEKPSSAADELGEVADDHIETEENHDDADAGDADEADDDAEEEDQEDAVVDETPPTTEDELPADWIEAIDESSGQTYYYNTVTQETSWEKPSSSPLEDESEAVEQEQEEEAAEATEEHDADQSPADEWIEAVDDSTGQTYYYNTVTQETSWEKPSSLITSNESEQEVEDGEGENAFEGQGSDEPSPPANDETESTDITDHEPGEDSSSPVLPEYWTSAVDETTGKTYYFNSLTQETSWVFPQGNMEPAAGVESSEESSEERDLADLNPAEIPVEKKEEDLPENWSKEVDETNGEVYYYNNVTHESSWEKPGVDSDADVQDSEQEETEHSEHETDIQPSDDMDNEEGEDQQSEDGGTSQGDWIESVDEASGQTYFYNTVTGETSWEKPTELIQVDDEVDEDQADDGADNDIDDAPPTNTENDDEQEEGNELPANWIEAVDESSGQTYYYNTETQETVWEKPVSTSSEGADEIADKEKLPAEEAEGEVHDGNVDGPPPADDEAEMIQEEQNDNELPLDWTEVVDEASGQIYYYNSATQETSWEKPSMPFENTEPEAAEDEIIPPVDSATEEASVNDEEPAAEGAGAVESSELPDDWIEAVDEGSGQTYYYNTVTQETSWEKPHAALEEEVVPEGNEDEAIAAPEAAEPYEPVVTEATDNIPEGDDLPSGWIEAVDESSGQTYYYNTVTQETSWDKPTSIPEEDAPDVADEIPGSAIESGTDSVDVVADVSVDTEGEGDEAEGKLESDNDDLPRDWIEAVDESSGQTYYYNTATQETSWEKPSSSTPIEDAVEVADEIQDAVVENVADADAGQPVTTETEVSETAEQEEDPSSDWVETVDDSTGQVYYFNTVTQETSWEKPFSFSSADKDDDVVGEAHDSPVDEIVGEDGDEVAETEPVEENEQLEKDALPSEWIEAVDEASGETYYYNTVTEETSWEKPLPKGDEIAVVEDNSGMADKALVSENRMGDDAIDVDKTDAAIGNSLDVSQESLPSGWVEVVDEDSGNVYFYNSETNETSWEKPSMKASEPTAEPSPNELDQEAEIVGEVPNEEWEIVDEPKDDVMIMDDTKHTDVDLATHIANLCDEREEFGILGPLSLSEDEAVLSYIKSKSETTRNPLWGLIDIAARSRGRLRSEDGVADRNSPESSIVELLLREARGNTPAALSSKQHQSPTPAEEDDDLRIERVQSLLLRGNRVEAVKEAVECKDFATALLVASMCDPETYKFAAKAYAENVFVGGSPMYTIGMLFSGSIQVPSESSSSSFWGIGANELNSTWKKHLAAVISNRTVGWDRVVLSLGDRLREIGSIEGAHFCYMVCGCPFTDPLDTTTRVSLLGCDHVDTSVVSLSKNAAIDSFYRTEAYEWAKRLGNKNATIKSFQPFKVILATSLVDFGFEDSARLFALGIRHCSDVPSAEPIDLAGEQWGQVFEDPTALAGAFCALEERLDLVPDEDEAEYDQVEDELPPAFEDEVLVAVNPDDSYAEEDRDAVNSLNLTDNDATFVTAASNLMDKPGFSVTPQREALQAPTPEPMALQEPDSTVPSQVEPLSTIAPPVAPSKEEVPKNVTQAMPPRMPPTPTMRNSASNKEEASTPMPAGPPAAAPMPAVTPQETMKKPEKAPSTAPSVMMGKKNAKVNKKSAPSSTEKPRSGGLLSGFRSMMIKRFNKDAVECSLPDNEEKAYYDEKLKRWVFPGDDLDELAKPMAPPPMIPGAGDPKPAPEPETKPDANDPLAAMMAPPSRRPAALRRPGGTPSMPPGGGGMPPMPGMPPMMPGMPSPAAAGGGAAAPPQFAVFTPSKKVEEQKKDEE